MPRRDKYSRLLKGRDWQPQASNSYQAFLLIIRRLGTAAEEAAHTGMKASEAGLAIESNSRSLRNGWIRSVESERRSKFTLCAQTMSHGGWEAPKNSIQAYPCDQSCDVRLHFRFTQASTFFRTHKHVMVATQDKPPASTCPPEVLQGESYDILL